jgi:septum formation protein
MPKANVDKIILASESPRRIHILSQLGLTFHHEPSGVDEGRPRPAETPRDYARRLATAKARKVAGRHPSAVVIGADTLVVERSRILGKPADAHDAAYMLRMLSGRWHEVVTGICIRDGLSCRTVTGVAATAVKFRRLNSDEIAAYIRSGEPLDKAGAYAIQEKAALFVEEIRGCYFNVVGFPVALFLRLWKRLTLPPFWP